MRTQLNRASALFALMLIGLMAAPARAQSGDSEPGLAPQNNQTAIEWFDAVDKASRSKGWSGFEKTVSGIGKVGASLVTFGAPFHERKRLPGMFQKINMDSLAASFYPVAENSWNVRPYGIPLGERTGGTDSHPDAAFADWCRAHEGIFDRKAESIWACEKNQRFLAVVHWVGQHTLTVMQPKDPSEAESERFTHLISSVGIQFRADLDRDRSYAARAQEAKWRAWKELQQREAPLRRQIGTRICQDDDRLGAVYTGYIESRSPDADRVQIRVNSFTSRRDSRISVGGFMPTIIWDDPDKWYVCN
jgi:hypothetical protein